MGEGSPRSLKIIAVAVCALFLSAGALSLSTKPKSPSTEATSAANQAVTGPLTTSSTTPDTQINQSTGATSKSPPPTATAPITTHSPPANQSQANPVAPTSAFMGLSKLSSLTSFVETTLTGWQLTEAQDTAQTSAQNDPFPDPSTLSDPSPPLPTPDIAAPDTTGLDPTTLALLGTDTTYTDPGTQTALTPTVTSLTSPDSGFAWSLGQTTSPATGP
jgi:hypothetical protein